MEQKNNTQEINDQLLQLENQLKNKEKIESPEQLNAIYSICHQIGQLAAMYGINALSGLFSPIENHLSDIIENKKTLSGEKTASVLSAVSISFELIKDPSLNNPGIKTNYNQLKAQLETTFSEEKKQSEDLSLSNSRFQDIFIEEANDLINQLEEKLLQLEGVGSDLDLVDDIFRIMHTLKGNSNMFGYAHLGEITHHLENIYDAIRSEKLAINRDILDITLQCIDHFRNLIEDIDLSNDSNKEIQESILQDIEKILDSEGSSEKTDEQTIKEDDTTGNMKTFYFYFEPEGNIFDDGTNPLYFIYDLHDIGNCLINTVTDSLPEGDEYNPENCYTSWHVVIATSEAKDTLIDNFMFLKEESQPKIEILNRGDLTKNNDFVKTFHSLAIKNNSVYDQLHKLFDKPETAATTTTEARKIKKSSAADSSIASIRVSSAKIDLMMNLISELVTKQAELSMISDTAENTQLTELAESIESISRDLRDNAFSISLIPLEKSVLRFQRLVRDVSGKFDKQVDFVVEGKETELDKTIIEKIVDPIMHILRNSIDHGIETPAVRTQKGKTPNGTIRLRAFPSGAHVIIEISDDGSGIDIEKVRKAAIRKGYLSETDPFTTEDMIKMILSPGFSTAENISEVSGRGVGMDVVNQKIAEIRGELDIKTEKDVGTVITIKLPLTISIIDSLLVMIGETYYLIPLSVVERCAEVLTPTITEATSQYLNLDHEYIPFIDLHKEFEFNSERLDYQRLILVKHKDMQVALVVDQIVGNHQAVLKSLGQAYRKQEIISGASILGNGEVALVMDTNKLVQEFMATREDEINKIHMLNTQLVEHKE